MLSRWQGGVAAVRQLKAAPAPLLQILDPQTRLAVGADQPEPS